MSEIQVQCSCRMVPYFQLIFANHGTPMGWWKIQEGSLLCFWVMELMTPWPFMRLMLGFQSIWEWRLLKSSEEAANVIFLEKSLGVIVHGVEQGRHTFINTVKYIKMACSSNFGNVFSVLGPSLDCVLIVADTCSKIFSHLPYQPIQPLQLLFQNLLYNFSQDHNGDRGSRLDEGGFYSPKEMDNEELTQQHLDLCFIPQTGRWRRIYLHQSTFKEPICLRKLVLESPVTGLQKDHNQTGLRLQKTEPMIWSFDFENQRPEKDWSRKTGPLWLRPV